MICKAPFNNMYITLRGSVSPCWKLPGYCDQWSKDRSLMDIWRGDKFQKYRDALSQSIFLDRCKECEKDIADGVWPLARAYKKFPVNDMPSLMEIELSNQCNLECIMCSGELSSGIRKNREKLPPIPQIFDESFVEQMKEFLPHLTELRINGGEPFAQKIVLELCEVIAEIAPDLHVNIATNGTVWNKRVQKILETCNIHLNISVDALTPELYEEIRINAKWDVLIENIEKFRQYCSDGNRELAIMVNPMNNNWHEMGEFVHFANNLGANLWYNTILYPKHLTIKDLPYEEIAHIHTTMSEELSKMPDVRNKDKFEHLVKNQIAQWRLDAIS